ncbi:hypothetical protein AVEN_80133-1 [Araneus ventricosus]|uniref:Uncharacterized protein n=1 Tax=Araneus ventricosus TaxID=182803 RepID=A0A4Y2QXD4_ARAVE|nr:hypothetical protein AVEN_80133-1 [Araneus ventricosus]
MKQDWRRQRVFVRPPNAHSRDSKGSPTNVAVLDMGDVLSDGVTAQTEADEVKEEAENREGLEPVISKDNPVVLIVNGLPEKEEVGENNNEPATPNQPPRGRSSNELATLALCGR